jgi:YD repeat-containing protein
MSDMGHSAEKDATDWLAEAALYCEPHGEKHDEMACLRMLAEAATTGGQWVALTESCDCGDGYGCSHGTWVYAVHMDETHHDGKPCDPENSLDSYRHARSEISEFTWDEAHYLVAAQPSVVLALLDRIEALEARVTPPGGSDG